MSLKSSLMFAKSLIFPKTEKKSSARKSLTGALLCIALSIIPMIVVISVANGMISGMTDRIIGLATSHLQAYVASGISATQSAENFTEYAQGFVDGNEVLSAYPEVDISALAAGKSFRTGAEIRALPSDIFQKNHYFKDLFEVQDGSLDDFYVKNEKTAIVGQKIAKTLGLKAGDTFRLITTRKTGDSISPKLTSFKVSAIVTSGYQELDQLWIFVPLETAFSTLSLSNATFTIMMETPDAYSADLPRIQQKVWKMAGRYANIYRWDQLYSGEFQNFSSTKMMLIFIMALIVLVASINISSAIIMLVMERKNEIAILKSIGATPAGITLSFLLTGLACGAGGLLIGLPIGILIAKNASALINLIEKLVNQIARLSYIFKGVNLDQVSEIHLMDPAYYIQKIVFDLPLSQIFIIVGAVLLLSVLVSVIPAIKAGKEKPLEIMRKN